MSIFLHQIDESQPISTAKLQPIIGWSFYGSKCWKILNSCFTQIDSAEFQFSMVLGIEFRDCYMLTRQFITDLYPESLKVL